MENEVITFSFGQNWRSFVDTVSEDAIARATKDIEEWLGRETIKDKSVLDIGCGSGIHSLCFYLLGAREVVSLDVDPYSVESTKILWEKAKKPSNWKILHGSVLDKDFMATLEPAEIVYSWGVLHHTGSMWEAIDNASQTVKRGGLFWIAIYTKGPKYPEHLALKRSYNRASKLGKKIIARKEILKLMRYRWDNGQNPFTWNEKRERGMDMYHDIIDWLGGLPYEVASKEEIISFCQDRGFKIEKNTDYNEQTPNIYLFSLPE